MSVPRVLEVSEVPADARLPTDYGEFRIKVFQDEENGLDHVALLLGDMHGPSPVLVRVHSAVSYTHLTLPTNREV